MLSEEIGDKMKVLADNFIERIKADSLFHSLLNDNAGAVDTLRGELAKFFKGIDVDLHGLQFGHEAANHAIFHLVHAIKQAGVAEDLLHRIMLDLIKVRDKITHPTLSQIVVPAPAPPADTKVTEVVMIAEPAVPEAAPAVK